ncbi:protein kinase domain-containing protein [Planosporangium sp. 12N6]|uniref:serine/threonine-protein kinase n=1 Tax=Planosporangium spinosum TaxID=3402278 RepID=UPI003CF0D97C
MQAGTLVGDRYELTYPVGRGGMGEVWAGYDRKLDRPVAVKVLHQVAMAEADRDTTVERFMREARVTARLDHPGVPNVHDVGFHDGDIYIVMQLVSGVVLADLVAERGRLPVPWSAAIGAQICSVLAAAHADSLVHRDLKPQNVIVTPAGTVKVLDFGIAALLGPADVPRLTVTGETLGTPTYMAPEQALGGAVGPRADLYALGCVLFELLVGEPPYQADTALGMLHSHMNDPVPLVDDHRDDVPDGLTKLVARLLAKDPLDRPESAVEVYELLMPWAAEDVGVAGGEAVMSGSDGAVADPTMPYRYPFGPLPRRRATAPTKADGRQVSVPTLAELQEVRDRAAALAEEERFSQAAEALESALRSALGAYGGRHPRVLDARLDFASMLLLAGDYRRALPEFERLATDLAARMGPDDELVWYCRQQGATCQAELGEATEALRSLRALLADQRRVLGVGAAETFPLQHEIALLTAGVGDVDEARRQLQELLAHVRRVHGPDSSDASDIEALLAHLSRLDKGWRESS